MKEKPLEISEKEIKALRELLKKDSQKGWNAGNILSMAVIVILLVQMFKFNQELETNGDNNEGEKDAMAKQMVEINDSVSKMKAEFGAMKKAFNDSKNKGEGNSKSISSMGERVGEFEGQMESLSKKIEGITGKKSNGKNPTAQKIFAAPEQSKVKKFANEINNEIKQLKRDSVEKKLSDYKKDMKENISQVKSQVVPEIPSLLEQQIKWHKIKSKNVERPTRVERQRIPSGSHPGTPTQMPYRKTNTSGAHLN